MKLISPLNDLYVTITSPMQDFVRGLHVDTRYNPEEHVQLIGKVHSLPLAIQQTPDYRGYSTEGIKEGDTVLMQYDVVHNYREQRAGFASIPLNVVRIGEKEWWKANILSILAVIRDGEFEMVNGWVMISKPKKDSRIVLAGKTVGRKTCEAWVMHIGKPRGSEPVLDVQKGDIVFFDGNLAIEYSINGKDFAIIRQKQILGCRRGEPEMVAV